MQGSLPQWSCKEIEAKALLTPPWWPLGPQSPRPRVILKTDVIAQNNAFRKSHACLLLPRWPIRATSSVQDSSIFPGCRTGAGIYQAAASQAWFVVKEGKKKTKSPAVSIGILALGFAWTISTKYVWQISPPQATPPCPYVAVHWGSTVFLCVSLYCPELFLLDFVVTNLRIPL